MNLMKPQPANEVRFDPNHALARIFRILPKEYLAMPNKLNPRTLRLQLWEFLSKEDGYEINFKGLLLLDVFDLHVLLALVAIAVQCSTITDANAKSAEGQHLHKSLGYEAPATPSFADDIDNDSHQLLLDLLDHEPLQSLPIAAVAHCSRYALTKLVTGKEDGKSFTRVKESLWRLLHTTLEVKNPDGSKYTSNMISSFYEHKDKKQISIAVNPVLTNSLRLNTGARYIKLYLDAFSSLSTVGKLLYTYLSARTWDAKPHEYTTDTLARLMYPVLVGSAPISRQAETKRLVGVATAMKSLNKLEGWQVVEKVSAKGLQKWVVTRLKAV